MYVKYKISFIVFSIIILIFSNSISYCYSNVNYIKNNITDTLKYQNLPISKTNTFDTDSKLNINSRSCIVIDRLTNLVLFGKNQYNKVKMASTTKIMTAIIIIQNSNLNEIIKVSKKAANTGGSRLGLKTGDKITIKDLLYGLMLCSGNDAAVALAESISGNIENFCTLMNKKAKELGLINTNFESPHGLDSENHYTTAYELALLSNYALKDKTFFNIVGTKNYTVTINNYSKSISNTNELLGTLSGIYGIKTGFTNGANRCLVTACKRDNLDIICVVLGADTKKIRTTDSIKLIEYTFNTFKYINITKILDKEFNIWKNEHLNCFQIDKGLSSNLDLKYSLLEFDYIPVRKDSSQDISISFDISSNLIAPIKENQKIGNITITIDENHILNCNILSNNTISKKNTSNYIYLFLKNYSTILNSQLKNFFV